MTMVVNQVNDVDSGIDYWMSTHTELKSERETVERGKYTMGTERERETGKEKWTDWGKKEKWKKMKILTFIFTELLDYHYSFSWLY